MNLGAVRDLIQRIRVSHAAVCTAVFFQEEVEVISNITKKYYVAAVIDSPLCVVGGEKNEALDLPVADPMGSSCPNCKLSMKLLDITLSSQAITQ
ncbi:hypothetical protein SDJN02_03879, partial [Cucurbita argyrosperma subsp. argyrosperma]